MAALKSAEESDYGGLSIDLFCFLSSGRLGGDPTGTYGHTTYSSSNGGLAGGGHVDAPTSSPGIPANATLVSRTKQQLTTQQVCYSMLIFICFVLYFFPP